MLATAPTLAVLLAAPLAGGMVWVWARGYAAAEGEGGDRSSGGRASLAGAVLGSLGVAGWSAAVLPPSLLAVGCLLGWSLLALSVVDLRHFLLPDALTLPLIAAGLAVVWTADPALLPHHAVGAAVGFAGFAAIDAVYRRLRGRCGLGLGDAKLLAAAGAWVSWWGLPSVILAASLGGLAVALAWRLPADARLPFGPFLCLGLWAVWLHGPLL